ncbi:MAG: ion transporter [Phycisphaerales bacterium]|nr:ion transporter [Phycisphaerales bacterium]
MLPTLKQVIEQHDTRLGRAFDLFIQALIVLSLLSFSLETTPHLSEASRAWLGRFETFSVVLFTVEYLLRIYVARPRLSYIFSFFGIVDLLAILPFYIGLEIDLRSIRTFRLLRLFRIFKFARYSAAMRRFHLAVNIAKEEIILFLCATLILLYLAAVGIYYFESDAQPESFGSVFHCLWWAVATLTTVGYGDVFPITVGGKLFTFFILLIGLGVISVPAGLVASALGKARQLDEDEQMSKANQPVEKDHR